MAMFMLLCYLMQYGGFAAAANYKFNTILAIIMAEPVAEKYCVKCDFYVMH